MMILLGTRNLYRGGVIYIPSNIRKTCAFKMPRDLDENIPVAILLLYYSRKLVRPMALRHAEKIIEIEIDTEEVLNALSALMAYKNLAGDALFEVAKFYISDAAWYERKRYDMQKLPFGDIVNQYSLKQHDFPEEYW